MSTNKDYDVLWDDGRVQSLSGRPLQSYIGKPLSAFTRSDEKGVDGSEADILWDYFMYLCRSVGLNGPDKEQSYRTKETDDKTYFVLALKMFNLRYKVLVDFDRNRVEDARKLREDFALNQSRYKQYAILDTPGASMLEVIIALVNRFDTYVMMTEDGEDRSKQWFWEMMKNSGLDIFVDSYFEEHENGHMECDSVLNIINDRTYSFDGKGGFFPLLQPKSDVRRRELWFQMHDYFNENHID